MIDQQPRRAEDGKLQYGSISIDHARTHGRARTGLHDPLERMAGYTERRQCRRCAQDYVEEGDPNHQAFRFIATLRDLATYVHFDALYEAYLNACIWLLNAGAPFDPNFRHLLSSTRHTTGFALYRRPAHPVADDRGGDARPEGGAFPEVQQLICGYGRRLSPAWSPPRKQAMSILPEAADKAMSASSFAQHLARVSLLIAIRPCIIRGRTPTTAMTPDIDRSRPSTIELASRTLAGSRICRSCPWLFPRVRRCIPPMGPDMPRSPAPASPS